MAEDKQPPGPTLRIVPKVDQETRDRLEAEARVALQKRDQRFAEARLRYKLRSLAANVLRIVRGAGKPYELAHDAAEMLKAFDEYEEAFGRRPSDHDVGESLRVEIDRSGLLDRNLALEAMTKGALQLAASTLLKQIPQMASGEHELTEGVCLWNKYVAEENAKRACPRRLTPKPRKPKSEPGKRLIGPRGGVA